MSAAAVDYEPSSGAPPLGGAGAKAPRVGLSVRRPNSVSPHYVPPETGRPEGVGGEPIVRGSGGAQAPELGGERIGPTDWTRSLVARARRDERPQARSDRPRA